MKVYQRNNTWWADFSIDGTRFRVSLDVSVARVNEARAEKIALKKYAAASKGTLPNKRSRSFARLNFKEAADKYLQGLKVDPSKKTGKPRAESTIVKETQLLVKPRLFFGLTRLNQITAEQIRDYQEKRAKQGCGPATLNMETGVLRRILQRGKLWDSIADQITTPRPPPTIGRALTRKQRTALLEAAALKPEWQTAYYAAILALNTTMRGCEIRGLRWSDIDLLDETLNIRKSKTEAGERIIPLNGEAFEVLVQLRKRAETFGEVAQEHYVFASFKPVGRFHRNEIVEHRMLNFDPTKPIGSWKKAWGKLTAKAGLPGLRFHDLRHDAVTRLLTNPKVSIQTAKAIAGHISQRMQDRYAHIHLESRRNAVVEGLSESKQPSDLTVSKPDGMPIQIVQCAHLAVEHQH